MTLRKRPSKTGLLPKLKGLLDALGDRYHRVLQVIDEALESDSLKDRIWAVDLILKKTPTDAQTLKESHVKKDSTLNASELEALSDSDLLARIQKHLKGLDIES